MKNYVKKMLLAAAVLATVLGFGFVSSDQADAASANMTAATLNYTSSTKNDPTTILTPGGSDYYVYSIEVKAAGKLYVDAAAFSTNAYGASIAVGEFNGSELKYNTTGYVSPGETRYGIGGYDVKSGTYYVGVQSSAAAYVQVTAYVIPYSTRTLAAGKEMLASGYKGRGNKDSAVKFRIKPKKSGYIIVDLKEYGYDTSAGYVTLLNSRKKAVSEKLWYYSSSDTSYVTFGVRKGVTYYLRVTGAQGSSDYQYAYAVKYTMKKAVLKNNTKKGKAVTLKRKAKAKAMTRPATGKAMNQWYKFKVTKKRKTQILVDAGCVKSGTARITVYCGSKKVAATSVSLGRTNTYTVTHSTTYGMANPGTYYIKISTGKTCSGMYKIRYLK